MQLTQQKKYDFTQYINYVAILYAFIIPLSRAGIGILTAAMIFLWLLEGDFKEKMKSYKNNHVILALLSFLVYNLISLFWTDDVAGALHTMKRYWYLFPIFVFMYSIKKECIPKLLSAFILGMFVSEVIAYGVFFELWDFKHATVANPSPFMHHIIYSVFLSFTALILLNHIFNFHTLKHKMIYVLFFITVTGNLFLTAGRTGQFAFIVGLFTLVIVSFRYKLKAFILFALLAFSVLSMSFNLSETFQERIIKGKSDLVNVIAKKDYCTSWGSRVGAWIISKDMIRQHPLIGMGKADHMHEFHQLIDTKYPSMKCMHGSFRHVHNQYLEIWTALGLVGLVLFLWIFLALWRMPIKDIELSNIKYLYISILLFAFIPEVLWGRQFSLVLVAFVFGILLAQHRIENETSEETEVLNK